MFVQQASTWVVKFCFVCLCFQNCMVGKRQSESFAKLFNAEIRAALINSKSGNNRSPRLVCCSRRDAFECAKRHSWETLINLRVPQITQKGVFLSLRTSKELKFVKNNNVQTFPLKNKLPKSGRSRLKKSFFAENNLKTGWIYKWIELKNVAQWQKPPKGEPFGSPSTFAFQKFQWDLDTQFPASRLFSKTDSRGKWSSGIT